MKWGKLRTLLNIVKSPHNIDCPMNKCLTQNVWLKNVQTSQLSNGDHHAKEMKLSNGLSNGSSVKFVKICSTSDWSLYTNEKWRKMGENDISLTI